MPDRCPPREALQRALRDRANGYQARADLYRKLATELGHTNMSGETVTLIWDALSESTPGMERPPK